MVPGGRSAPAAWLTEQVFPKEAQLTPEDVYVLTKLAILEYLTSGITAMFDMYFARDSIAQAAIDTGFRACLVGCANDYGGTAEETVQEYERFSALHPRIAYQLGFHGEYTTSYPLPKTFGYGAFPQAAVLYTPQRDGGGG